ncbi:propionyl-CoA carboxylase beta chain [Fusarium redolens]|uniref:Propionyl-CoA carboxylase beta chain n=1 Tax=Fusarium redolens TaxID=48865 RepID=A0A9P9JPR7_FUSRE|nr:propionyl-CoA carboxylase beta chain [Fusarium redolens]KAH7205132.1 propionyl-CoA carboxylase beta chain [Fusarium redolens]
MSAANSFPLQKSDPSTLLDDSRYEAWTQLLDQHNDILRTASSEGTEASKTRHQSRGQLLARDRVSLLLDQHSPFLELCALAGHGLDSSSPSASLVAGIGTVSGKLCLILSHIPTLSGGAWNELTVLKQNRVTQVAGENNLPIVALVQSAGVFLPQQFRVFHKGGQIFRDLAVFLGGPPLVKMATGEVVDAETLGGANMHGSVTGLADQVASDGFDAIRKARDWVNTLNVPTVDRRSVPQALPPRYSSDELLYIVDPDICKSLNIREVLLRIVDDSRWLEYKPEFGQNIVTSWATIHGHRVGMIANSVPVINAKEAMKDATFIKLCNQQNTPIVFFHNVTGFMVGAKAEQSAIIKHGAQLVSAVSCSKVPHLSIIVGASYGAGNYAMCGRAYQPRFLFSWPSGRCSVMGPDQLVGVMQSIGKSGARNSKPGDELRDEVLRDGSCYRTSSVLLDDGVIDPRDTRDILGLCLDTVASTEIQGAESCQGLARL